MTDKIRNSVNPDKLGKPQNASLHSHTESDAMDSSPNPTSSKPDEPVRSSGGDNVERITNNPESRSGGMIGEG